MNNNNTKLILLDDGVLVEVQADSDEVQQVSGGRLKPLKDAAINNIKPIITKIIEACREISKETDIEQAEIELGLSYEGEGNIFITKSKVAANLVIRITLKPRG